MKETFESETKLVFLLLYVNKNEEI